MSKDEIAKLVEEDRREKEHELTKQRADEEAERRRNMRIMGDLEEDEDFEAFELRQKAEKTVMNNDAEAYDNKHARTLGDDEDDIERGEDEDFDEEDYDGAETEIENLSRTKLTEKDYIQRAQTAKSSSKGKYGVTVPKPFAFDMRAKQK